MSTPRKPSPPAPYISTFSRLKDLGPIGPFPPRSQRNSRAVPQLGQAPTPTPPSNSSRITGPPQTISRPQPARPFGMVDATPPAPEDNPWNAAVKPWQRGKSGGGVQGSGKKAEPGVKELQSRDSRVVKVAEKEKGNRGGKPAFSALVSTSTSAPAPAPSRIHHAAPSTNSVNTSASSPSSPAPYISSMSRAHNPGTIGGPPRRKVPAVPMSREDAMQQIQIRHKILTEGRRRRKSWERKHRARSALCWGESYELGHMLREEEIRLMMKGG
ncbi:hypothetical protein BKA65DRAFT_598027 [Rhexocercosporidium sp. MPI-PUGE-AT-0058]|nr:hypothetical protein BKA65DRAFT_598027 [Rhexocercosporidium sp. MPI-PUGE-AT-0058]